MLENSIGLVWLEVFYHKGVLDLSIELTIFVVKMGITQV